MMVLAAPTSDAAATSEMRSMRTGVLIHPDTARDGRFLILPHPRTGIPTYYLFSTLHRSDSGTTTSDADLGQLLELSTLKDARYDRSWMISGLNQVVASAQLEILSRVDVRFLVVSMLYSALDDGKFRSLEDTFEQIALTLHSRRKDELVDAIQAVKTRISQGTTTAGTEVEEDGVQQEWTDLLTFGTLPIVKQALTEVADVQDLPNGDKAYRLSTAKLFSILDNKHNRLSLKSTFVASPNMLGRSFERRWQLDSDPSAYLTDGEHDADSNDAKQLRSKIAAEIIATNLPPQLAADYFAHLDIAVEQ